jgi:hypothetical protein
MAKRAIYDLISLYDTHRSPVNMLNPSAQRFTHLISLLRNLSVGCDNPNHAVGKRQGDDTVPPTTGIMMPLASLDRLFGKSFLTSTLRQQVYADDMIAIFVHWCYGNQPASHAVIDVATAGADANSSASRQVYFKTLDALMDLKDSVTVWRHTYITRAMIELSITNARLPHFRDGFVHALIDYAEKYPDVPQLCVEGDWEGGVKSSVELQEFLAHEASFRARFVALWPGLDAILPPPAESKALVVVEQDDGEDTTDGPPPAYEDAVPEEEKKATTEAEAEATPPADDSEKTA